MAFTAYHNVNGANGVDVELLAPGDNANNVKSILFTNVDDAAITLSLFIQDDPSSGSTSTFYLIHTLSIPQNASLLLDDKDLLKINNGSDGYGLYVTVGSGDVMDVFINR